MKYRTVDARLKALGYVKMEKFVGCVSFVKRMKGTGYLHYVKIEPNKNTGRLELESYYRPTGGDNQKVAVGLGMLEIKLFTRLMEEIKYELK